jgi:hypothetical protein
MRDISAFALPAAALAQAGHEAAVLGAAVPSAGFAAALQTREAAAIGTEDAAVVAPAAGEREDGAAGAGELAKRAIGHRAPAAKA